MTIIADVVYVVSATKNGRQNSGQQPRRVTPQPRKSRDHCHPDGKQD